MKNIFENAYFGKAYKTRDGRLAIFLRRQEPNSKYYLLLTKADFDFKRITVNLNGKCPYEKNNDIVSKWQESINNEELDRLANEYVRTQYTEDNVFAGYCRRDFKAGYRKAKGE